MNGEITEAPLKTKNSYRRVSISPQAIEVLKAQKAKTSSEYVFPSPTGGPIALQNGVDIKTVSSILGHFSAGFTLDTYAHVTTAAQKEAAITMGNVLEM